MVSQKKLFEEIDNLLSELLDIVSEEEYTAFIEKDSHMKIYDSVAYLEDNKYGILSDEMLNKILNYVQAKLDMYK